MHLTVRDDFFFHEKDVTDKPIEFKRGDKIHDADLIAAVMKSECHRHVVRTAQPAPHNED